MIDPATMQKMLEEALAHHQAGRLPAAEKLYRQILAHDPNHADALHLLALLAHQAGNTPAAIDLLRRSIAIDPNKPETHRNLATLCRAAGRFEAALDACRSALRLDPADAAAHQLLGATLVELGRFDEGIETWRRMIAVHPARADAYANLAATLEMLGRLEEALPIAARAVEIDPNYAHGHVNYGAVLSKLGRMHEALEQHQLAARLQPDLFAAQYNLAHTLQDLGRLEEAAQAARRAIAIDPRASEGHRNLATALQEQGRLEESLPHFDNAIRALEQSIASRNPPNPTELELVGQLKAVRATLLPVVYNSIEEIDRWRQRLIVNLDDMTARGETITLRDEPSPTLFHLAYQGRDDREIAAKFASLVRVPPLPRVAPIPKTPRKIRVGFISRFFRNHTIGRLNRGLIAKLSRERFEVVVFSVGDHRDEVGAFIREHADRYIVIPPLLERSRRLIAEQNLDVLHFADLGMEGITYGLAFSRFAPVQCVTWGHPVTSGIHTIDYFISSESLETGGSQLQYTEKLVKLRSLPIYYYRPTTASTKSTVDFGLPDNATIYGCLQVLYKFHPDFDNILGGILRRDPRGRVIITRGMSRDWEEKLTRRFAHTIPDVVDRIQFIPPQPLDDFLRLTSLCDVMLDPVHFGGGNTSYEAFAFGVPIVTLPSQFLRGRITKAQYDLLGVDDCIATSPQDFIDIAGKLGADRDYRKLISDKILDAVPVIFENLDGVRELESFYESAVRQAAST